jgi:hypothetical protein
MPVILATQETEIRRLIVQSQPEQIVHETLSQETLHTKNKQTKTTKKEKQIKKPFTKVGLVE